MSISTVGISVQSASIKRAKRFFTHEYVESLQTELDFFALWPEETKDPSYFWKHSPPPKYSKIATDQTLLWLVPLDNNHAHINKNKYDGVPWPYFGSLSESKANAKPNKTMRYIGRLTVDGELIILGWVDTATGRYNIPYSKYISVNFRNVGSGLVEPKKPLNIYEGKWAYYALPDNIGIQLAINYGPQQLKVLLMS